MATQIERKRRSPSTGLFRIFKRSVGELKKESQMHQEEKLKEERTALVGNDNNNLQDSVSIFKSKSHTNEESVTEKKTGQDKQNVSAFISEKLDINRNEIETKCYITKKETSENLNNKKLISHNIEENENNNQGSGPRTDVGGDRKSPFLKTSKSDSLDRLDDKHNVMVTVTTKHNKYSDNESKENRSNLHFPNRNKTFQCVKPERKRYSPKRFEIPPRFAKEFNKDRKESENCRKLNKETGKLVTNCMESMSKETSRQEKGSLDLRSAVSKDIDKLATENAENQNSLSKETVKVPTESMEQGYVYSMNKETREITNNVESGSAVSLKEKMPKQATDCVQSRSVDSLKEDLPKSATNCVPSRSAVSLKEEMSKSTIDSVQSRSVDSFNKEKTYSRDMRKLVEKESVANFNKEINDSVGLKNAVGPNKDTMKTATDCLDFGSSVRLNKENKCVGETTGTVKGGNVNSLNTEATREITNKGQALDIFERKKKSLAYSTESSFTKHTRDRRGYVWDDSSYMCRGNTRSISGRTGFTRTSHLSGNTGQVSNRNCPEKGDNVLEGTKLFPRGRLEFFNSGKFKGDTPSNTRRLGTLCTDNSSEFTQRSATDKMRSLTLSETRQPNTYKTGFHRDFNLNEVKTQESTDSIEDWSCELLDVCDYSIQSEHDNTCTIDQKQELMSEIDAANNKSEISQDANEINNNYQAIEDSDSMAKDASISINRHWYHKVKSGKFTEGQRWPSHLQKKDTKPDLGDDVNEFKVSFSCIGGVKNNNNEVVVNGLGTVENLSKFDNISNNIQSSNKDSIQESEFGCELKMNAAYENLKVGDRPDTPHFYKCDLTTLSDQTKTSVDHTSEQVKDIDETFTSEQIGVNSCATMKCEHIKIGNDKILDSEHIGTENDEESKSENSKTGSGQTSEDIISENSLIAKSDNSTKMSCDIMDRKTVLQSNDHHHSECDESNETLVSVTETDSLNTVKYRNVWTDENLNDVNNDREHVHTRLSESHDKTLVKSNKQISSEIRLDESGRTTSSCQQQKGQEYTMERKTAEVKVGSKEVLFKSNENIGCDNFINKGRNERQMIENHSSDNFLKDHENTGIYETTDQSNKKSENSCVTSVNGLQNMFSREEKTEEKDNKVINRVRDVQLQGGSHQNDKTDSNRVETVASKNVNVGDNAVGHSENSKVISDRESMILSKCKNKIKEKLETWNKVKKSKTAHVKHRKHKSHKKCKSTLMSQGSLYQQWLKAIDGVQGNITDSNIEILVENFFQKVKGSEVTTGHAEEGFCIDDMEDKVSALFEFLERDMECEGQCCSLCEEDYEGFPKGKSQTENNQVESTDMKSKEISIDKHILQNQEVDGLSSKVTGIDNCLQENDDLNEVHRSRTPNSKAGDLWSVNKNFRTSKEVIHAAHLKSLQNCSKKVYTSHSLDRTRDVDPIRNRQQREFKRDFISRPWDRVMAPSFPRSKGGNHGEVLNDKNLSNFQRFTSDLGKSDKEDWETSLIDVENWVQENCCNKPKPHKQPKTSSYSQDNCYNNPDKQPKTTSYSQDNCYNKPHKQPKPSSYSPDNCYDKPDKQPKTTSYTPLTRNNYSEGGSEKQGSEIIYSPAKSNEIPTDPNQPSTCDSSSIYDMSFGETNSGSDIAFSPASQNSSRKVQDDESDCGHWKLNEDRKQKLVKKFCRRSQDINTASSESDTEVCKRRCNVSDIPHVKLKVDEGKVSGTQHISTESGLLSENSKAVKGDIDESRLNRSEQQQNEPIYTCPSNFVGNYDPIDRRFMNCQQPGPRECRCPHNCVQFWIWRSCMCCPPYLCDIRNDILVPPADPYSCHSIYGNSYSENTYDISQSQEHQKDKDCHTRQEESSPVPPGFRPKAHVISSGYTFGPASVPPYPPFQTSILCDPYIEASRQRQNISNASNERKLYKEKMPRMPVPHHYDKYSTNMHFDPRITWMHPWGMPFLPSSPAHLRNVPCNVASFSLHHLGEGIAGRDGDFQDRSSMSGCPDLVKNSKIPSDMCSEQQCPELLNYHCYRLENSRKITSPSKEAKLIRTEDSFCNAGFNKTSVDKSDGYVKPCVFGLENNKSSSVETEEYEAEVPLYIPPHKRKDLIKENSAESEEKYTCGNWRENSDNRRNLSVHPEETVSDYEVENSSDLSCSINSKDDSEQDFDKLYHSTVRSLNSQSLLQYNRSREESKCSANSQTYEPNSRLQHEHFGARDLKLLNSHSQKSDSHLYTVSSIRNLTENRSPPQSLITTKLTAPRLHKLSNLRHINKSRNDTDDNLRNLSFTDWKIHFKTKTDSYCMPYIDSHCHIDFLFNRLNFSGSWSDYINLNKDTFPITFAGCVAVFCNPSSFKDDGLWTKVAVEKNVWLTFGCHPKNATEFTARAEYGLRKCLKHEKVVALGEIGLDYSGMFKQHLDIQKMVFKKQLTLAMEMNKPLVIHCRDAEDDCLEILEEMVPKNYKIHCHCFTGNYQSARRWLTLFPNLYIGLTPLVTFASAIGAHDVAKFIPLNRLLLETDAPYFIPRQVPKDLMRYSHPGMAITVAETVAGLKNISVLEVLYSCWQNTRDMYGI